MMIGGPIRVFLPLLSVLSPSLLYSLLDLMFRLPALRRALLLRSFASSSPSHLPHPSFFSRLRPPASGIEHIHTYDSDAGYCIRSARDFSLQTRSFSSSNAAADSNTETISVTFVEKDGTEKTVKVPLGMSMLEAAHKNDIELEGACEGSLACSTCHVIVMDEGYYNKLSEPTDEENDMLDLAFGLTETSRLGCQVIAKPELDGMRLLLPSATRNFAVDGYVPKPH